jgi:hypothetical protein
MTDEQTSKRRASQEGRLWCPVMLTLKVALHSRRPALDSIIPEIPRRGLDSDERGLPERPLKDGRETGPVFFRHG